MLLPAAVSAVVIKHNSERGNDDLRGDDSGKNCDPSAAQSGRVVNTIFGVLGLISRLTFRIGHC